VNAILVDTSHLLYRSHHTFTKIATKAGEPTGIHFGVMRTIEHLKKRFPDAFIVFCLDGYPHARKEFYPEYKANRSEQPQNHADIIHDFGVTIDIKELVKAAGCAVAHNTNYESDDIIAMIALTRASGTYIPPVEDVYVYSGDDDFNQLVRGGVTLWKPPAGSAKRGGAVPERMVQQTDVLREWGVDPESMPLLRSFYGDSGDNIKGLPRVPRDRTQMAVMGKETPEQFYEGDGLAYYNPEWRQKLLDFRNQCNRNYRVTRLPWDFAAPEHLPVDFDWCGLNISKLVSILEKLEFSSFLKKIGSLEELLGPGSYATALKSFQASVANSSSETVV